MSHVLLVIDLVKGFCEEGRPLYCGASVKPVISFARKLIEGYNQRDETVIFPCDNHDADDVEFELFGPHCIAGSEESEIVDELRGLARNQIIVPKKRYSSFFGTNLAELLTGLGPDLVEVVGVCTNICVLYTVEDLRNHGYKVRVYRRGVTSFDPGAHVWALREMEKSLGVEVT